jgi:hypothetical protein
MPKMKGEMMAAGFWIFLVIMAFLVTANYPLSDMARRYAYFLDAIMLIFTPIVILHKW